jgi:two-component system NarL family sensor kinase
MQTKYPEIYTQILANIIIIGLLVGFIAFLTLLYQKRKIQQKKELELVKALAEKDLLKSKLEIQEEIERNISMEIHDNVGQILLLANVNMTIIQKQLLDQFEIMDLIKESKELIGKSIEEITTLSRSMNPDRIIKLGVFYAIVSELENLKRKQLFNIQIHLDISKELKIKPEIQMIIFRVYQEAIKNVIKYANATEITFETIKSQNNITIIIKDNGSGFDDTKQNYNGLGLLSMQKRVATFDGNVVIDSAIGKGTAVKMTIPTNSL